MAVLDCERLVHTECVMNIGSSESFMNQCKPTALVSCLKKHLTNEACSTNDADTLPTINNLISSVKKKFEKDPKFCLKEKKFQEFVRYLQDHFTGIAFVVCLACLFTNCSNFSVVVTRRSVP